MSLASCYCSTPQITFYRLNGFYVQLFSEPRGRSLTIADRAPVR